MKYQESFYEPLFNVKVDRLQFSNLLVCWKSVYVLSVSRDGQFFSQLARQISLVPVLRLSNRSFFFWVYFLSVIGFRIFSNAHNATAFLSVLRRSSGIATFLTVLADLQLISSFSMLIILHRLHLKECLSVNLVISVVSNMRHFTYNCNCITNVYVQVNC